MKNKFYLTANIKMKEETVELRKEVASVIKLPTDAEKQPDLSYFSAILVSSGENLNHAYFLGSELVAAANTVVSKALDIEHKEQDIIGHIYSDAFTDATGNELPLEELASIETATLDSKDMHIQIGCIVYKNRFPEIAKEIAEDGWKISMECYYMDYDVKIGDMILPKDTAKALGIETANDSVYGKKGIIKKDGKEIANGTIARVLRGICFSGCGIVKNPANPASVILETASDNINEEITFDLDLLNTTASNLIENEDINVTSKDIDDLQENTDTVFSICSSYKKTVEDQSGNVINENWCNEYSNYCTSASIDVFDQGCIKNKIKSITASCVENIFIDRCSLSKTTASLERLRNSLDKSKKFVE